MAIAGDPQALELSLRAVELGWLEAEPEQARRQFWLMPLMHSEDLAVQEASLPLFQRFSDPRTADFARRHRDVIARFGRFPHRNAVLGQVAIAVELGLSADAGLTLLKRLSAQRGRQAAATGERRAASPAGASGPRA